MVISIETTMTHPRRGFIKLEDTIAVIDEGCLVSAITDGAGIGPNNQATLIHRRLADSSTSQNLF